MDIKEMTSEEFSSFINSQNKSMETKNYILRKWPYHDEVLIFAEMKLNAFHMADLKQKMFLAVYNKKGLIYNPLELHIDCKGLRENVHNLITVSNEIWIQLYLRNQYSLTTDFFRKQYHLTFSTVYSEKMLNKQVLEAIVDMGSRTVSSITYKDLLEYMIRHKAQSAYTKLCPISYLLSSEDSFVALQKEFGEQIKHIKDPGKVNKDGVLKTSLINTPAFLASISACKIEESVNILHQLNFDPFCAKSINLRKKIRKSIPGSAQTFHVIFKDDKGFMRDEKLGNGEASFSCLNFEEPFFLGLVQTAPKKGNDYSCCFQYKDFVIIPLDRIKAITYHNKTLLDLVD